MNKGRIESKIGFMQGRLSPKPADRIQAFPKDSWEKEFEHAQAIGFGSIELIYDVLYLEQNPLHTPAGIKKLLSLSEKHQVRLGSICADYFMIKPLESHLEQAQALLQTAADLKCPMVEFPFVDSTSLLTRIQNLKPLQDCILKLCETADQLGIILSLETDLPPAHFAQFLKPFPDFVGANLDLGNSSALGYDAVSECKAFGKRIRNVHVKDRILGGTTVPLLTGDADLPRAFAAIKATGYSGDYVLQTAPDPDFLGIAAKYRKMVEDWIS